MITTQRYDFNRWSHLFSFSYRILALICYEYVTVYKNVAIFALNYYCDLCRAHIYINTYKQYSNSYVNLWFVYLLSTGVLKTKRSPFKMRQILYYTNNLGIRQILHMFQN